MKVVSLLVLAVFGLSTVAAADVGGLLAWMGDLNAKAKLAEPVGRDLRGMTATADIAKGDVSAAAAPAANGRGGPAGTADPSTALNC